MIEKCFDFKRDLQLFIKNYIFFNFFYIQKAKLLIE